MKNETVKDATIKIPGFRSLAKFPPGVAVVGIVAFKTRLFVALSIGVYELIDDELVAVKFATETEDGTVFLNSPFFAKSGAKWRSGHPESTLGWGYIAKEDGLLYGPFPTAESADGHCASRLENLP